VVCRLARCQRPEATQSLRQRPGGPETPERHAGEEWTRRKKNLAATSPLTATITAWLETQTHNTNSAPALASLARQSGSTAAGKLSPHEIGQAIAEWKAQSKSQHTRKNYCNALRRFLNWTAQQGLTTYALLATLPRIHQPDPRLIIATPEERAKLLDTAAPNLRFFILLCADLGLRHKTAAELRPVDYDPAARTIRFRTKGAATQTLPVTDTIADTITSLPSDCDRERPIVALLPASKRGSLWGKQPRFTKQWQTLKQKCGVRSELHIHDLRRTAAEEVWDATTDLRAVQAQLGHTSIATTARYLANRVTENDLRHVRDAVQRLRSQPRKDTKHGS